MWSKMKALFALVVAVAVGGDTNKPAPFKGGTRKSIAGREALLAALDEAGVTDPTWRAWFVWVALQESGWQTGAWNGRPQDVSHRANVERAAALKAYNRLVAEGRWSCAKDPKRYGIGSGGWFGQLAPFTSFFLEGDPLQCDPLQAWLDPQASIRAHVGQVNGTLGILASKGVHRPTLEQLRALYGLPKRDPNNLDPKLLEKYALSMEKAGYPRSELKQRVPGKLQLGASS